MDTLRYDEIKIGSSNIKITANTDYLCVSPQSNDITVDGNVNRSNYFEDTKITFTENSNVRIKDIELNLIYKTGQIAAQSNIDNTK